VRIVHSAADLLARGADLLLGIATVSSHRASQLTSLPIGLALGALARRGAPPFDSA
jgi:hypothetical protein